MLNRTIKNSISWIDKEKNECWKLQKFKWTRFQIVIVFCLDNWQATDFLKEIITNIYNSFILAKILTSFRDHFIFFCRFVIHHSICISWFDNDHSIAKHFNLLHSNNNFLKHSYILTVTKKKSHIIEDVIAISCNFTFSSLSIEAKCIFFLETQEKIMQRMLCSIKSTKTSKSIETINFYDDEYEFVNVRRWQITFSFLIDSEYFNIFDFNEFVNILSFIFFDISFFRLDIILYISDLLSISNLVFYFLDYATYHIWFESRLKSVTFLFVFKK